MTWNIVYRIDDVEQVKIRSRISKRSPRLCHLVQVLRNDSIGRSNYRSDFLLYRLKFAVLRRIELLTQKIYRISLHDSDHPCHKFLTSVIFQRQQQTSAIKCLLSQTLPSNHWNLTGLPVIDPARRLELRKVSVNSVFVVMLSSFDALIQ